MAAAGRLVGRYELLDGEVVSKMGQKPAHAMTLTRLMALMVRLFGADFIRIQAPITLSSPDDMYNEPEPDIAVTRSPADNYASVHPGPDDLAIIVEVSDTTLRTDRIVKTRLYARSGIPEYWIIDLSGRQLHIHRQPVDGNYAQISVHGEGAAVAVAAHPETQIAVSDLLPPSSVSGSDAA